MCFFLLYASDNVYGQNKKVVGLYEQQRNQIELLATLESGTYNYEFFDDGSFIKFNGNYKGKGLFYIKNDSIVLNFQAGKKQSHYIASTERKNEDSLKLAASIKVIDFETKTPIEQSIVGFIKDKSVIATLNVDNKGRFDILSATNFFDSIKVYGV